MMFYGCKNYIRLWIKDRPCYEERVLLVQANSFDDAIAIAEEATLRYARKIGGEYVEYIQCYHAKEFNSSDQVTEVYSHIRSSDLLPNEYLNLYEDSKI